MNPLYIFMVSLFFCFGLAAAEAPIPLHKLASTLGGRAWSDTDGDGFQDPNEPGLSSVTMELFADADANGQPDGQALASTSSDPSGNYQFASLTVGNYLLKATQPGSGYTSALQLNSITNDPNDSDFDPSSGLTHSIALGQDESVLNCDAGFIPNNPSILIVKKANGQDANTAPGVIVLVPNTPPLVNFTFEVTNAGNLALTNVVVTDNVLIPSTICTFSSIAPGVTVTCTASATALLGLHTNTATATGQPVNPVGTPLGSPVSDTDPANYTGVFINMDKTADKTTICPGETVKYTLTASMSGGAPGVQIRNVEAMDNNVPGTFTCNGLYWSGGDLNGNCILDFIDNDNNGSSDEEFMWMYTKAINATTLNTANDMGELWYVDPNTGVETFIGNVGNNDQVLVAIDPTRCAEIGNFVWEDQDGDGVQDAGEPGIANVPVTLTGTNIDNVAVTLTTTTSPTGQYLFSGLVPGTYKLTFGKPSGTTVSPQGAGSSINPTTLMTVDEVLTSGENNTTYDAGFIPNNAQYGNLVWDDLDGDGTQDVGEPGIPGLTVTLTGTTTNNEPVSLTTFTNSLGNYTFTNLAPGTYRATFGTPTGSYILTGQDLGGNDAVDSDAAPGTQMTINTLLTPGESDLTWDAGFYRLRASGTSCGTTQTATADRTRASRASQASRSH